MNLWTSRDRMVVTCGGGNYHGAIRQLVPGATMHQSQPESKRQSIMASNLYRFLPFKLPKVVK